MAPSKELILRVLAEFDAEHSELAKAIDDIEAGTQAMTEQFGASAAAAHKAFDTIGLGAAKVSGLQKFKSAFHEMSGVIGTGIGKIDEFGKALGPWNQTLELGGKALRFLGDGLDAYAKTSASAKAEVEKLTKEFTKMKDAAMAAVGEFTVAVAKSIDIAGGLKKLQYGLGAAGTARMAFDDYFKPGAQAARGIEFMFGGGIQNAFADQFRDSWYAGPTPDELLGKVGEKMKEYTAAAKKAAEEEKKLHEQQRKRHAELMQQIRVALRESVEKREAELEREAAQITPEMSREQLAAQRGFFLEDQLSGKLPPGSGELKRREQATFLEDAFGPIDQFNAYATAFGTLNTAVQSAMQAWISGSLTTGQAIKKGIGDALGGLASQLAVESLKHGAYALGSLAIYDFGGAARHGAAAAAFGAGAVAAAAAARKLGSSASVPTGGAGGGAGPATSGAGATPPPGASGALGTGGGEVIRERATIVYMDSFSDESPTRRRQNADRYVRQAWEQIGARR